MAKNYDNYGYDSNGNYYHSSTDDFGNTSGYDSNGNYYHSYTDDEIHKINTPEKMMAWMGIMKDTMMNDSVSKIAEVMINGTVMGIIEGRKILNHKKMDKKIHNIVDKYIKVQEKYLNKLKEFL